MHLHLIRALLTNYFQGIPNSQLIHARGSLYRILPKILRHVIPESLGSIRSADPCSAHGSSAELVRRHQSQQGTAQWRECVGLEAQVEDKAVVQQERTLSATVSGLGQVEVQVAQVVDHAQPN